MHFRALPYGQVGAALGKIRTRGGQPIGETRVRVHNAVHGPLRRGRATPRWDETDLECATWTNPAERMKAGRECRMPLSETALKVLADAAPIREEYLVLPPPSRDKAFVQRIAGQSPQERRHRRRAARVPLVISGLGGGMHRDAACGDGGRVGVQFPERLFRVGADALRKTVAAPRVLGGGARHPCAGCHVQRDGPTETRRGTSTSSFLLPGMCKSKVLMCVIAWTPRVAR